MRDKGGDRRGPKKVKNLHDVIYGWPLKTEWRPIDSSEGERGEWEA